MFLGIFPVICYVCVYGTCKRICLLVYCICKRAVTTLVFCCGGLDTGSCCVAIHVCHHRTVQYIEHVHFDVISHTTIDPVVLHSVCIYGKYVYARNKSASILCYSYSSRHNTSALHKLLQADCSYDAPGALLLHRYNYHKYCNCVGGALQAFTLTQKLYWQKQIINLQL